MASPLPAFIGRVAREGCARAHDDWKAQLWSKQRHLRLATCDIATGVFVFAAIALNS
jgi:hypothetical protein